MERLTSGALHGSRLSTGVGRTRAQRHEVDRCRRAGLGAEQCAIRADAVEIPAKSVAIEALGQVAHARDPWLAFGVDLEPRDRKTTRPLGAFGLAASRRPCQRSKAAINQRQVRKETARTGHVEPCLRALNAPVPQT